MARVSEDELRAIREKDGALSDMDFVRSRTTELGRLAQWFVKTRQEFQEDGMIGSRDWNAFKHLYNQKIIACYVNWQKTIKPVEDTEAQRAWDWERAWNELIAKSHDEVLC